MIPFVRDIEFEYGQADQVSPLIRRVVAKIDPTAPHHSWLVVDGSLGANSIEQARVFHQSFGLTGIVVTKLDGTSRGGALVG